MYQRRNGRQLMIVGGGVIVLVLLVGYFLTRSNGPSTVATTTSPVVVALQTIPQGTTFQAGQPLNQFFGVQQVPKSMVPLGSYSNLNQINNLIKTAGCVSTVTACRGQVTASQSIFQNLPVVSGMFSTLGTYRVAAGPAFQIPYGYVGIAVNFDPVNSVLGSINPGDDVDLIASWKGIEKGKVPAKNTPTQTQYVLNDMRVIGVNGPPAPPPAPNASGSTSSSTGTTAGLGGSIIVLARYQEALLIQHLKDFGGTWSLSVVLRSAKETEIPHFRTLPVTMRWYFVKQANHFDWSDPY